MAKQISKKDKTSLVIDREKVERVKEILGTGTLADTSAWHRSIRALDRWLSLYNALALCTPVRLELLNSARGPADYRTVSDNLLGFRHIPMDERAERVAARTQAALAERSQHRGPTPIDLLI